MKAIILTAKKKRAIGGKTIFVTGNKKLNGALKKLNAPEDVPSTKKMVLLEDVLKQSAKKVKKEGNNHYLILDSHTKREILGDRERHIRTKGRKFRDKDRGEKAYKGKQYRTVNMNSNFNQDRERGIEMVDTKPKGFFARVNETLGMTYELSDLYGEALKVKREKPEAVIELRQSESYKGKLVSLAKSLAEYDTRGFNTVRDKALERYFGDELPKGVLALLDMEATRRSRLREKVQGRPFALMAPFFKEAWNNIPANTRRENGIYPKISHSMYLRIEVALKEAGKFVEAMKLSGKVPLKWRKPFETNETVVETPKEVATKESVEVKNEVAVKAMETENVEEVVEEESTETDENVAETQEKVTEEKSPEATT